MVGGVGNTGGASPINNERTPINIDDIVKNASEHISPEPRIDDHQKSCLFSSDTTPDTLNQELLSGLGPVLKGLENA
jgi:hypothetical protein